MKFCVTLACQRRREIEAKLLQYHRQADLIEVRLDYLQPVEVPRLPQGNGAEFVATCRPEREGGRFSGEEEERLRLLSEAANQGYQWVDVEHDSPLPLQLPNHTRLIRSLHRFNHFPHDPASLFEQLSRSPGDLHKLVLPVASSEQLVQLLTWMEESPTSLPRVIIGMGELGQASRYLGALLGNLWTYVSEPAVTPVASGQFSIDQAQQVFAGRATGGELEIYGILGRPLAQSLSPYLHNQLFRDYGISALFLPLELDRLQPWFSYLDRTRLPFRGFSVTIPFKNRVRRFLYRQESTGESVNTLRSSNKGWVGSNTDRDGFLCPLNRRGSLTGLTAVVLGNGGAARTVVEALQQEGVRVTVAGRDPEKVDRMARFYSIPALSLEQPVFHQKMIVNTTPVGQFPHIDASPIARAQIGSELVYDLIYNPSVTKLLSHARARGCATISGLEMFVEQAALQFRTWTGIDPDRPRMKELVRGALAAGTGGKFSRD